MYETFLKGVNDVQILTVRVHFQGFLEHNNLNRLLVVQKMR